MASVMRAKPPPDTHAAHAAVAGADGHVDHGDFVFNLADTNAQLLGVAGEPFEDVSGRAHRISAVELASRHGRTHRQDVVAVFRQGPFLGRLFQLFRQGLKILGGIIPAGVGGVHIILNDLRFFLEGLLEQAFEVAHVQTHELRGRSHRHGVLHDRQRFVDRRQVWNRQRAQLHALGCIVAGLDLGLVVNRHAAGR